MEKNIKELFVMLIKKGYISDDEDISYLGDKMIDVMYDFGFGEDVSRLLDIANHYEGSFRKFEGEI